MYSKHTSLYLCIKTDRREQSCKILHAFTTEAVRDVYCKNPSFIRSLAALTVKELPLQESHNKEYLED